MNPPPSFVSRELSSWKEIAQYLGVSVRTAQSWERDRGLPVRRLPGGRSPVTVSVESLDAWRSGSAPVTPRRRWWRFGIVAVVVVLVLGGLALVLARRGPPAAFRVDRNVLVVLDAGGRELWRKQFSYPLRGELPGDRLPHAWFGDLDGDGGTAFLFVAEAAAFNTASTPLVCYSSRGVERWRFLPGRTVRTSSTVFAPPYSVQTFAAGRVGNRRGVVVSSAHSLYYPDQVVLLSTEGRVLREYWHSGALTQIALADVSGEGKNEIVLGGVNNGYRAATLIVLDPDTFSGASVETIPGYQLLGFSAGVERARILFPRSCMNRLLEPYGFLANLWVRNSAVTVDVWDRLAPIYSSLHYQFDKNLQLQRVTLSDAFLAQHRQLEAARQLDHQFSPAEEQTMHQLTYLRRP